MHEKKGRKKKDEEEEEGEKEEQQQKEQEERKKKKQQMVTHKGSTKSTNALYKDKRKSPGIPRQYRMSTVQQIR